MFIPKKTSLDFVKTLDKNEVINKVRFKTNVKINKTGDIEIKTVIKNKANFGRCNVKTIVRFMNKSFTNDENVTPMELLHTVETNNIILYGIFSSAFSAHKKSSTVQTLQSVLSVDNITINIPHIISNALKELDTEISKVAVNLRKAKILNFGDDLEIKIISEHLQELKKSRMEYAQQLEQDEKFKQIFIDIQHIVKKVT